VKTRAPFFFKDAEFIFPLLLCAVVFCVYSVSLGHNFLFDEQNIVLRNPLIRQLSLIPKLFQNGYFYNDGRFSGSWTQYYRPLTSATFAVDYHFWGVNPLGCNLTNVALHCLVCLGLFKLLVRILDHAAAAFLSTLLYSVHTVHTEAVTYLASRGDLLGTLFMLAGMIFYLRRRVRWALFCYVLALFSKESSILLPFYLFILHFCFVGSGKKVMARQLAPFVIVSAAFFVFRNYFCPVPGPPLGPPLEAARRFFSMGGPFLSYLEALVAPEPFKFSLNINFANRFFDPKTGLMLLLLMSLSVAWLFALRRKESAFFGLNIFLVGLLPYSQIIHFYPEWAEHYLYMPAIGLTVLLACLLKNIFLSNKKNLIAVFFILYIPFFSFLCFRTWQRNVIYNNPSTYYELLSRSDSIYAYFGYQNSGRIANEEGRWEEAVVLLRAAQAMEPHSEVTHHLLGSLYSQKGQYPKALEHFKRAYECSRNNYHHLLAVGAIYLRMGRTKEAGETFEKAQRLAPTDEAVYVSLMAASELLGDPNQAKRWADKGLAITKDSRTESGNLALAVVRMAYRQKWDAMAKFYLSEIVKKKPDIFWVSDVARLLSGMTPVDQFMGVVSARYYGSERTDRGYILMAYVMQARWDEAQKYLEKYRDDFEKQSAGQALFKKEIERAQQEIQAHISS